MKKYLVINADDFGLSHGTNRAILKAHQDGVLTSTSLFATTPGFKEAVRLAKANPNLGLGIHLSLTWGKSVLGNQYFQPSYTKLIFQSFSKKNLRKIEDEFNAQVNKILKTGLKLDHLNSQQHVHMIPHIFPVALKLAQKYHIKYVRIPSEPFYLVKSFPEIFSPFLDTNFIKYLLMKAFSYPHQNKSRVRFYGLMYTTKMSQRILSELLPNIKPGITEILSHPAFYQLSGVDKSFDFDRQLATPFMKSPTRKIELDALIDHKIKKLINQNSLTLTNYRELS